MRACRLAEEIRRTADRGRLDTRRGRLEAQCRGGAALRGSPSAGSGRKPDSARHRARLRKFARAAAGRYPTQPVDFAHGSHPALPWPPGAKRRDHAAFGKRACLLRSGLKPFPRRPSRNAWRRSARSSPSPDLPDSPNVPERSAADSERRWPRRLRWRGLWTIVTMSSSAGPGHSCPEPAVTRSLAAAPPGSPRSGPGPLPVRRSRRGSRRSRRGSRGSPREPPRGRNRSLPR